MTDLRDPRQLELAEKASAAAARAISHDSSLRFAQHLLHQGRRVAPVRAPHVHPSVDTQDLHDLRGGTDAIAIRLKFSDRAVFAQFEPDGAVAQLVYELLEQFRVEALTPESLPGVQANLRHRFASWTSTFIDEGLLENEQGLLLFTVIQVCRSRILAEPLDDFVNDVTEATRAGMYEVLGTHLTKLRPTIADQAAFDALSAEIAVSIDGLATQMKGRDRGARSTTALAMLTLDDPELEQDPDNVLVASSRRQRRLAELASYHVLTRAFDVIAPVSAVVNERTCKQLRTELDAAEIAHRKVASYLDRSMMSLFGAPTDWELETELEEGRLDSRLLSRLATGATDTRVFADRVSKDAPQAAVTILVDCSGSMKSVIEPVTILVDLLIRALDRVDVATQLLGFTTSSWNGGRARDQWLASGRPAMPGRMNETCQLIFKDASTSWRRSRTAIAGMIWTPMFREGIDGEALEWAYERTVEQPAQHRSIILISDGSPMDGATSLANGETYLDRHLTHVAEQIESVGLVRIFGLGIGHDMSSFLEHSRVVDPEHIVSGDVAASVVEFLAHHSGF